ncbi:hypothetical protein [uncultured Arthrobacter sp.]|uniref:hypothetical protein n=1 Tax=uncultured Arthrobacter sp. TaxID=114050 RepID=UPI002622C509|nr:hypothetical protein [uncultured Arthrobacter sp.]
MSDEPAEATVVDLASVTRTLRTALLEQPGILRLEPTVHSTLTRLRASAVDSVQRRLRSEDDGPQHASSDGLALSLADGLLTVQIDIATDIGHSALTLAETAQTLAARTIERSGFTVGSVAVTILSIEGGSAPAERPAPEKRPRVSG